MTTRSKALSVAAAVIAILAFQAWALVSTRNDINDRLAILETEIQSARAVNSAQATQMTSDLGVITSRMGVTAQELNDARKAAAQFKAEQARTAARLKSELEAQSKNVNTWREESTTKITEVQEQAATQIGAVSGDVQNVKVDLDTTKTDLTAKMTDMRDALGRDIARNSTDVAELRRRGERDFFEFDIRKNNKAMDRVADIQLQLKKADVKNKRFDVALLVDDARLEKKGQLANELVTFLVGRDRLRYELVVYSIEKDRIRGYVSAPKDKVLSAEGPAFRPTEQQ